MAYDSNLLTEIRFFIKAVDEDLMIYKLDKIGVQRKDITAKPYAPSALRKDYVIEVNGEDYIKCINCDHAKISHDDVCYGLHDNINCNCRKFIAIS